MTEKIIEEEKIIIRHSIIELIEHWALAVSGLLLIFSGFGELPMYKRFMVTKIPGLNWAGDYFINLKIHYIAGFVFISIMIFHIIYHGLLGHKGLLPKKGDFKSSILTILSFFGFGKEPKFHKYLPEQRVAYAYLGLIGLILVITGVFKVLKNLPEINLKPELITTMTLIHTFGTLFFLLGVLAHLAALIFKVNRPLLKSIFIGEVDLNYIKERHTIWYEELINRKAIKDEMQEDKEIIEGKLEFKEDQSPIIDETSMETKISMLKVLGMSCGHCVESIKKKLEQLEGIEAIEVNLEKGEVYFENKKGLPLEDIKKAIEEAVYKVSEDSIKDR